LHRILRKIYAVLFATSLLSGCLVTSVVSGVVGTAVDVVDTVTPDITD
jgi:hypothetical protein